MPAALFRFQEFELDQVAYELRRGGQSVRLERIPFELLSLLLERHGQLVTRDEIIERVWGKGVFHDTEHGINTAVRKVRLALQDDSDSPRFVVTVPARGYRFVAPVDRSKPATTAVLAPQSDNSSLETPTKTSKRTVLLIPAVVLLIVAAAAAFLRFHRTEALAETDTIVIADFNNTTGDPVFDDSLKQALSVELVQSPFLNLVSPQQIQQTLGMMKQAPDTRLTPQVARQVCQRTNGAAVLQGSIAQIGAQYDLILKAVSCSDGELVSSTEARASDKNQVLNALDAASSDIRKKLGESLVTVQRFDRPLAQATTPSLEALKAFSLGSAKFEKGDQAAAIPFFQRAIQLDPDFAMAYVNLGRSYQVLGEYSLTHEPIQKAYALRQRASEREQFEIAAVYHQHVTLQVDQAIQNCELWEQSYPRDPMPHRILGFENGALARYERSAAEFRKAMQIDPKHALPYAGLLTDLMALNRFDEARAIYQDARLHNVDAGEVERLRYQLAFVERDVPLITKLFSSLSNKPGYEGRVLFEQSNSEAYFGHLAAARDLSTRSEEKALNENDNGTAAIIESAASVREALFGNSAAARQHAASAMKLGNNPTFYAMAVALSGDTSQALNVVDLVAKQTPPGSFVDKVTLGEFRAAVELKRGNASQALQYLEPARCCEGGWFDLYQAAYLRGLAYLMAHRGQEAAGEFQKILDHPGIVVNQPIGALGHLGLARACMMQRDLPKARAAYQDFLSLWKDADSDIPVLKQAKSEYAKLQ
jgi:DNA-binding winged helix-turn-helix (wHTH) protein/tetratricopeptide (TPR) repeat protein